MNTAVHFSSATAEWATPQALFDELDDEFNLVLDVCATSENAKCEAYFTRADDGLAMDWGRVAWDIADGKFTPGVWMNPPYGREIGKWVAHAAETARGHAIVAPCTVVALLPSRTDTRWWHEHIQGQPGVEVRFIKGRLKFGGAKSGAPFPSAVVVFRGQ